MENENKGIHPICDSCGKPLHEFGAILLSPPDKNNMCKKQHICVDCYDTKFTINKEISDAELEELIEKLDTKAKVINPIQLGLWRESFDNELKPHYIESYKEIIKNWLKNK